MYNETIVYGGTLTTVCSSLGYLGYFHFTNVSEQKLIILKHSRIFKNKKQVLNGCIWKRQ